MTEESKRRQYWDYLTTEKNQPRPKGITVQRLAVIRQAIIERVDLWANVIGLNGAEVIPATEFYQKSDSDSLRSRTAFWDAVRGVIIEQEDHRNRQKQLSGQKRITSPKRRTENTSVGNRRGRF